MSSLCESCGASCAADTARCVVCAGFEGLTGPVLARVDGRAFLCQQCGAPGFVGSGDPPPMCNVCGKAIELAPGNLPVAPTPMQADPGWGLEAGGRRQKLKSQEHGRKRSFYDLSDVPAGLEGLHQAGTHDAKVGALLAGAFAEARKALPSNRARADAGGGYREHAGQPAAPPLLHKTLLWIADRAVALYVHRNEAIRARPWVEQTLDLATDPGLRTLALCRLSALFRGAGAFDAAEQWLGACDPAPVDIELDSAWRLQRCLLLADRGGWQEITETLGATLEDVPSSLNHYVMIGLLRIASHETQSRMDSADREFPRLNEIAIDADIADCLGREPRLAVCRDVIRRYRDELERKEGERRRAEIRFGLIASAVGVCALVLCPALLWSGRSTTLSCSRPESRGAAAEPQCTITRFIAASQVEQIDVPGLRGATVIVSGAVNKRSYATRLHYGQGTMELTPSPCSRCGEESNSRAQRISEYLESPTEPSLRVTASDWPTTIFGVLLGFGALGVIAFGLLKVVYALTERAGSSDD